KDRRHRRTPNGPHEWVRRRSNPRLRLFGPPLRRLSYRPNEKGQASLATPGLASLFPKRLGVTSAEGGREGHSPGGPPDARPFCLPATGDNGNPSCVPLHSFRWLCGVNRVTHINRRGPPGLVHEFSPEFSRPGRLDPRRGVGYNGAWTFPAEPA